jgi:SAM-dependent methyltransferase
MNISDFYSDADPNVWKKVLGEDIHYHVGWGEGDILYNAITHLYQFIDKGSSVLDCGCGWGGPAKVIQRDLNCEVTGITNSKVQFDYIKQNIPINVELCDLHEYDPQQHFDVVLFVESFCHLENPEKVIKNISQFCDKIILREYVLKTDHYPHDYLNNWSMTLYDREKTISIFENENFKLNFEENHYQYALEPTLNYWLNKISKLDDSEKTEHLRLLENSSLYLKNNLNDVLKTIELSTFVFNKV